MSNEPINVCIVYPADPLGVIPGGIDTCIKGVIRWAPDDLSFSILGVTTDRNVRKVGRWTECQIGKKSFMFFPLFALDRPERQPVIPATIRLMIALLLHSPTPHCDLIQFHRIEPIICFLRRKIPKVTFIHQNMKDLKNKRSDIRWKYAPWVYYILEDMLIPRFDSVYVVHEQAAQNYRHRYKNIPERINFLPTWMDPEIFHPESESVRNKLRQDFGTQWKISVDSKILIWVGRIDHQKDPLLLIDSFAVIADRRKDTHLVLIGDGVLREAVEKRIAYHDLTQRVSITGLLSNEMVAKWLCAADLLLLSSAYEGMPRCVVEALGCGVPVATTDVGEVRRLIMSGINGEIATQRSHSSFSAAIEKCLVNLSRYRGKPCLDVANNYTPEKILKPVYDNYRRLVANNRT